MTKKWKIFAIFVLLSLSCTALLMAACGKGERVSDEKLQQLRAEYPYDPLFIGSPSASYGENWENYLAAMYDEAILGTICAVAVVQLQDDYFYEFPADSAYRDFAPKDLPETTLLQGIFHPAEVEQVLWGEGVQKGETLNLMVGTTLGTDEELLSGTYRSGARYVVMLHDISGVELGSTYRTVEQVYNVQKQEVWHLAKGDVLLAACSLYSCIDACSGMYLQTFEPFIREVFAAHLGK